MADNAIASSHRGAFATPLPDDAEWVSALHDEGIEYWAACNVFFDPPALRRHPGAIPVDRHGNRFEQHRIDLF